MGVVQTQVLTVPSLNILAFEEYPTASPFRPSRCTKASFYITTNRPNFPTTKDFRMKIPMKLVYQYLAIFFNFKITSSHLHPLQVENCDSNSRLVVDEDDNGKVRFQRVNRWWLLCHGLNHFFQRTAMFYHFSEAFLSRHILNHLQQLQ